MGVVYDLNLPRLEFHEIKTNGVSYHKTDCAIYVGSKSYLSVKEVRDMCGRTPGKEDGKSQQSRAVNFASMWS
jgi:hypothetical protein